MSQTYGSQVFGPWYDVFGLLLASATFFYFALAAASLPLAAQAKLPTFLLNPKLCVGLGTILAAFGIYKAAVMEQPVGKTIAPAAGWFQIHSNGKGDSLFIDPNTIVRKGDQVEYWSKIAFKVPRSVGQNLKASTLTDRYAANCGTRKVSHLLSSGVADTGQPINFPLAPQDMEAVPVPSDAGHPDAIVFRYVCAP